MTAVSCSSKTRVMPYRKSLRNGQAEFSLAGMEIIFCKGITEVQQSILLLRRSYHLLLTFVQHKKQNVAQQLNTETAVHKSL